MYLIAYLCKFLIRKLFPYKRIIILWRTHVNPSS
uniref:Uncharacterized protein n=1 Tax=Myoviridae sp. ct2iG11 TaxID=2826605 RepID=A0A8S5R049_9CAUD|nr:MAG TPA: hypothetical protein [Myoviridae sp. ct2iG11]